MPNTEKRNQLTPYNAAVVELIGACKMAENTLIKILLSQPLHESLSCEANSTLVHLRESLTVILAALIEGKET